MDKSGDFEGPKGIVEPKGRRTASVRDVLLQETLVSITPKAILIRARNSVEKLLLQDGDGPHARFCRQTVFP